MGSFWLKSPRSILMVATTAIPREIKQKKRGPGSDLVRPPESNWEKCHKSRCFMALSESNGTLKSCAGTLNKARTGWWSCSSWVSFTPRYHSWGYVPNSWESLAAATLGQKLTHERCECCFTGLQHAKIQCKSLQLPTNLSSINQTVDEFVVHSLQLVHDVQHYCLEIGLAPEGQLKKAKHII